MNGFLLDTNILLWAGSQPERLSSTVVRSLEQGPVWLSVISYWEVTIKSARGRLEILDPTPWWASALRNLAARPLAWLPEHVEGVARLPLLHQDPFDRALAAQALAEDLTLLSVDRALARYRSAGLRVMA